jgi:PAS domain S-box-containing protein
MQTFDTAHDLEFIPSFALQRQRLLEHAASVLGSDTRPADPVITQLSQMLVASLELLKVAEEELREERRASAARSTANERRITHLAALFDLAPAALLLTAVDTTVREANQAAARLLGWDSYELAGRRLSDMVSAPQRTGFREQLACAVDIGSVAAWSFRIDRHRAAPAVVSAAVSLISDAVAGTRGLYWSLSTA